MEFTSDCDSILTEDFASKFTEIVTEENCKDSGFSCSKSEKGSRTPIPTKIIKSSKNDVSKDNLKTQSKSPYFPNHDLESIVTENFEDNFHKFFNNSYKFDPHPISSRSIPQESCNTSINVDMGNISNVQPMRRDIMNKFLAKYAMDENQLMTELNVVDKKPCPNISINFKENFKKLQFIEYDGIKEDQRRKKESIVKNELANEIRKKSLRIQNEIHEERRKKLDCVQEKQTVSEQTPREKLDLKVKELDHLTDRMRQARSDRERITSELDQLRNKLKFRTNEISKDTKWKVGNNNCNDFKPSHNLIQNNQIQITENQLSHLNFQLNQKKSQLKDLEVRIRQRLQEIEDLQYIGLSRQEIEQVIEERNDLYEILRQSEENGNDKYELEKKLNEAKEDLSVEYKRSREKIMNLENELDNSFKKITELYEEKDRLGRELIITKETAHRQQDEMNELYQERNELRNQVDKYKDEIESERSTSREIINQEKKRLESHLATEEAQLKLKQSELKNEISSLQLENQSILDKNSSLKMKLSQINEEFQKLKITMDQRETEYRDNLQKTNEEKNQIIEKLKKDFYNNKVNEIQTLKTEFDSEQMRTINNLKDCYKQQVGDLQFRIENKTQELQDLRSEIRKSKIEFADKEEHLKTQYEIEISHLKDEIRRNSDSYEMKRTNENDEIKTRYEGLISKIKKEIDQERLMNERLRNAIDKSDKDLCREIELAKKFKTEKTLAINKVKELAKEKLQEEYKNLKQFYETELEEQLKIVEKTMQEKNCQLTLKCKEIKQIQLQHEENNLALQSSLNDFIEVLKHQCGEMANEAKFILPQWKILKCSENEELPYILQTTMRNLQICCQEYSQYYHEIIEKYKMEKEQSLKFIEDKTFKDIEMIREQIAKDHADELNSMNMHHKQEINEIKLKHQEEIENMRIGVKAWKCKTAERLAQKLQKEFHKEIEKKNNPQGKKISSSLSLSSFKHEISVNNPKPIGLIEDLRGNIRQLREENLSLRKVILGKSPYSFQHIEDQNNLLQSSCSIPNGSSSPVTEASRPQSACHNNYRNKQHSKEDFIQRSNSFKKY